MHGKQSLLENVRWGVAIVCVLPLIIAFVPYMLIIALADWLVDKFQNTY